MNRLIKLLVCLTVLGGGIAYAAPTKFTTAKFVEVVKDVNVISSSKEKKPAKKGASVNATEVIQTGANSRAELEFSDHTVTRVGSDTRFSFVEDSRTINLQQGSILFHSPKGKGGGTIQTAAATAAVTGTTIMVIASKNGFKLLVLEGNANATLPNGRTTRLRPGQMFFVSGEKTGKRDFDLKKMAGTSKLVNGFKKPLDSLDKIKNEATKQTNSSNRPGNSRDANLTKNRLDQNTLDASQNDSPRSGVTRNTSNPKGASGEAATLFYNPWH